MRSNASASAAPGRCDGIRRVLLVEDSMIIALDAAEILSQAGVGDVALAATVAGALKEIELALPDFAFLDYNLGDESSDAVAEALVEANVPYCFATGYGDALERIAAAPPYGVLTKPFSKEEIVGLLARVAADLNGR